MYIQIAQKLMFGCCLLGLVAGCGTKSKNNSPTERAGDNGGDILQVDPTQLKLAEPNEVSVKAGGHKKVEAQFLFKSKDGYKFQVASISQELIDCKGDQPAPAFSWKEEGASETLQLAQNSDFSAESGKSYILIVELDNAVGCRDVHISFIVEGEKVLNIADIKFAHAVMIREFGTESDTGALFLIRPSSLEPLAVNKIRGPLFLGNARVGVVDDIFVTKIFNNSATPLSEVRRSRLVEDYRGAVAIYFEGYSGRLCSEQLLELIVESTLREVALTSTFRFEANPSQSDDCKFWQLGLLTSY